VSRSDWRYVFAVGIAALLAAITATWLYKEASASEAFYDREARQNAETYRQTAREHAQRSCARVPAAERFECIHREHHEARDRQRQEYDLEAQLVTSAWTRAMGIAAIIGMFVGIVGIGLIYATFDATKEANRLSKAEADRNAQEADRARNHAIQTERAIITLYSVQVLPDEKNEWLNLYFSGKNRGRSNAWNLQVFTAERKSRIIPNKFTGHAPSASIVNAGDALQHSLARIKVPKHFPVWVFGYLSYTTVHDATFKSYFGLRLDGVPRDDGFSGMENGAVDVRGEIDLPSDS